MIAVAQSVINLLELLIQIAGIVLSGPATTMGNVALPVGQQGTARLRATGGCLLQLESRLLQEACESPHDWACAPTHQARIDP